MEKQPSLRLGPLERLQSFKFGGMEKQRSFKFGSMEKQKSFIERRIKDSPGKRGDTTLHLAARAGNPVHVQRIISECSGIQLQDLISKQNQDGETALYVASEKGHAEVVREILKASDVQSAAIKASNSFDAFHVAAKQGHLGVLKELLQSFPSLAMTTSSSNATALDSAATQGHVDIVNLLLETDASLAKIARNNGKTVLHSAARMGHVDVVRSLLTKDPDIGLRTDKKGQTAFHMAAKGNNVGIVLELLKPDSSIVNVEDNKGNTSLHIATRKGRSEIVQTLLSVEGIKINALNRAGETALAIAEKSGLEEIAATLREAGAVASIEQNNHISPAKQLKQTVSDIRHDVQSQLKQTRQTEMRVQNIRKRLRKLHSGGLNNAINSNTVVAVLIATVAFAAIFTVPGQFVQDPAPDGLTLGQANIANNAAFIIFLVFDSLALFISLAVVVAQTSLIVVEQKAKKLMVFIVNKLMWAACLFISISFISLTYIVVGRKDWWLAWCTMAIGASIMLTTIGSMCYFIVLHRMEEKSLRSISRGSGSRSRSWSLSVPSDSELLNTEYKKMYAI
ncbi:ankyrin repeat-containing protein At5g02620-like isoform X2 [Phalaenopsis equestris]|uniref:ankyrin repeat-containing protein At5g02620-like isoform X2 n=1 Tax=Phalaenopsis equestris TaxID=78828 RepID=UPI0009E3F1F1|nr:ankyrin repeat-containing protein At5g02620-like isoform X2 [Phalaenopsis equestris]